MLVLYRKEQEEITIGDNVIITILRINNESVRIGITAPKELPVHRLEVAERIATEVAERNEREKAWKKR